MKKRTTIAILLLTAVLMQYCKKSGSTDDTTTTTTTDTFLAYIGGVAWTTASYSAAINYSAANKTKTFVWTAVGTASDEILLTIKLPATKPDSGFAVNNYLADSVITYPSYNTLNASNVYTPVGYLRSGGYVYITAIDSIKKTVTGSFNYSMAKSNYDSNHTLISISSSGQVSGTFTAMPYTFKKL